MKNLLLFSLFASVLVGCSPDKSADVQTNVTPNGGKAYGSAPVTDPNVPAAAKAAIPGAGK